MREFWADIATKASWEKLVEISKEFDFVLIGGWAAYLWTGAHKSKDIDIIVDHGTLSYLKRNYDLSKNADLRKYEIKFGKFDIDIYVPFFSKLIIPEDDLINEQSTVVNGIKTVAAEALLVLKQSAEMQRRGTPKGMKDEVDMLTILLYAGIDWKKYAAILKEYGLENYKGELLKVVKGFDAKNADYLGVGFREFKAFQKKAAAEIKRA